MIQDIEPKQMHIEYTDKNPQNEAFVFHFYNRKVLVKRNEAGLYTLPTLKECKDAITSDSLPYLFRIDQIEYYLCLNEKEAMISGFSYENVQILRENKPKDFSFAGITAYHLYQWYRDNKFCGRCGTPLMHSKKERMLFCSACKNAVYPKIAPAVIVGIIHGDKILMTKYAGREYKKYALIAGFTEIGETLEDTVKREVMEEVGLKVTDITYYKSQPWGFDSNLLVGFFAKLSGTDNVTLDQEELATAEWFQREEIPVEYDDCSLTNDMIIQFKRGLI